MRRQEVGRLDKNKRILMNYKIEKRKYIKKNMLFKEKNNKKAYNLEVNFDMVREYSFMKKKDY